LPAIQHAYASKEYLLLFPFDMFRDRLCRRVRTAAGQGQSFAGGRRDRSVCSAIVAPVCIPGTYDHAGADPDGIPLVDRGASYVFLEEQMGLEKPHGTNRGFKPVQSLLEKIAGRKNPSQ
jgi:hypothetical protein